MSSIASENIKNIYEVETGSTSSSSSSDVDSTTPSKIVEKEIKDAKEDERGSKSAENTTEKAVNKSILNGLGDLFKMALSNGVNDTVDTSDVNMHYINKTYAIYQEIAANERYNNLILEQYGDEKKKQAEYKHKTAREINDFIGLDSAIYAAQRRLESAIMPVIDAWLGGEDYLQQLLMLIQNLRGAWEPICQALEPIRDFYSDLGSKANISVNGQNANLPLGLMAIDCLDSIIDYFENLLHRIELLATKYSKDEIDALVKVAGRDDDNWGNSLLNVVKDLVKLCIDCIQPYIQNCVLMLLLDAVNMFIKILKDAGLLEKPSGPLALIPIAITLVRSIAMGGLQRVEEQIRDAGNKLIKIVKCMGAFARDPDIFTDSEISALDYRVGKQLSENGIGLEGTGDYFGDKFVTDTLTGKFRREVGAAINDGIALRNSVLDNFNIAKRLRDYLDAKDDIDENESMTAAIAKEAVSEGKEIKSATTSNSNKIRQQQEVG